MLEASEGQIRTVAMKAWRGCNACGAGQPRECFERDGFHVVECMSCGLMYVGEHPGDIDFSALYDEQYYKGGHRGVFEDYVGQATARRALARRRLWTLRGTMPRGRLLDVGCAAGFFLVEAKARYDVKGVEFSEFSSAFAREEFGLDVCTGTLESAAFAAGSFDLVTLWDVIEHVPDPCSVLTEVTRVLAPNGRVVLTTGDIGSDYARARGADWHLITPPWHMYFFSQATMGTLAKRAGLRIEHVATRGVAGDSGWARSKPGILLSHLFKKGDIMQVTLCHA
jgi:SAM-dependent methyltransferase